MLAARCCCCKLPRNQDENEDTSGYSLTSARIGGRSASASRKSERCNKPAAHPQRSPAARGVIRDVPFISPECRRQILFKADLSPPGSLRSRWDITPRTPDAPFTMRLLDSKSVITQNLERLFEHFRRSSTSCARIRSLPSSPPSLFRAFSLPLFHSPFRSALYSSVIRERE